MSRVISLVWLLVAIGIPSGAEAAEKSVFLAPAKVIGVSDDVGVTAVASVAAFLGRHDAYRVVTTAELKGVLDLQKTKEMMGCDEDTACIAELSAAANTDLVIATTVGQIGSQLVLSLTLVDPKQAAPLARASETVAAADGIPEAAREAVGQLLGLEGAKQRVAFVLPRGKKLSFAVLDLRPTGVSKDVAENLTQLLSTEIKRVEGASVVSRDDLTAILSLDKLNQMLGEECDTSCVAELGGALGVDKLVSGSVGKLGESFFISLRMIDPTKVVIDNRVTESFRGAEDQLIRAINHTARALLGLDATKPGSLVVTASQEAADVYVDNEQVGTLPLPPIPDLISGRHSIRLVRDGFFDWQQDAYVDPGGTTALWAELEARPERWFEKWWVWATVGGVVVAGVTATLLVASRAPDNGIVEVTVK